MVARKKPAKAAVKAIKVKVSPPVVFEPEAAETAPEPPVEANEPSDNTVTNCLKGTILHLGDGRTLEHGESAEVSGELAAQLRESGQAE